MAGRDRDSIDVDRRFVEGELEDLLALESGLTDWEVEFIESLDARLRDGPDLTARQIGKLHKIWDRRCR